MNHRTRRGRYPKGAHQISNATVMQQSVPGGSNYSSQASEVPFYNPQQIAQSSPNLDGSFVQPQTNFHSPATFHQYPSSQHQRQPMQPADYWQRNAGLDCQDNVWNWTVSESNHPPQSSTNQLSVQQLQPTVQQTQLQETNVQSQQLKYSQSMNNIYSNPNYIHESVSAEPISNYNYPSENNWQSYGNDITNQNFQQTILPQQLGNDNVLPNISHVEQTSWNYNASQNTISSQNQWPNSENSVTYTQVPQNVPQVPQNVTQVPQNVPQVPQNVPQVPQNVPQVPQNVPQVPQNVPQVPQNVPQVPQNVTQVPQNVTQVPQNITQVPQNVANWSEQQEAPRDWQQLSNVNNAILNYTDNSIGSQNSAFVQYNPVSASNSCTEVAKNVPYCNYQENNVENLTTVESNIQLNNSNDMKSNLLCLEDPESGTVSNFFHNSLEENNELANEQLSVHTLEPVILATNVTQNENQVPDLMTDASVPTYESTAFSRENIIDNSAVNENSFVQKEIDAEQPEIIPGSLLSSNEEPPNQEVPEPHNDIECPPSIVQHASNQIIEEPQNQQIPPESVEIESFIGQQLTPEDEILENNAILSSREGSPFKPPSKLNNLVESVVQKESSDLDLTEKPLSPANDDIHGVNLETFPDNLERPFDPEKPHQEQIHNSRVRLYLDEESSNMLNTSSTSLLESPDIPCVTLAVAAPPMSPSHSLNTRSSTPSFQLQEQEEKKQLPVEVSSQATKTDSDVHFSSGENSHLSAVQTAPLPITSNQGDATNEILDENASRDCKNLESKFEQGSIAEIRTDLQNNDFQTSSPIVQRKLEPTEMEFDAKHLVGNELITESDLNYSKTVDIQKPVDLEDHDNFSRHLANQHIPVQGNETKNNQPFDPPEKQDYNNSVFLHQSHDSQYDKNNENNHVSVNNENRDDDHRHNDNRNYNRNFDNQKSIDHEHGAVPHEHEHRDFDHSLLSFERGNDHSLSHDNRDYNNPLCDKRDFEPSLPGDNRDYDNSSLPHKNEYDHSLSHNKDNNHPVLRDDREYDRPLPHNRDSDQSVLHDSRDYDHSISRGNRDNHSMPRDSREYSRSMLRDSKDDRSIPRDGREYDRSVPRDSREYGRSTPHDNREYGHSTLHDNREYGHSTPRDNRDYDRSMPRDNREHDRSMLRETREYGRSIPRDNRDHDRLTPHDNRDYDRSIPRDNRDYDRSTPRGNRDYDRSTPRDNRDYDRSVPRGNRDHDRSIPRDNRDYDRSVHRDNREYDHSIPRDGKDYDHASLSRESRDYDRSSLPRDYDHSSLPRDYDRSSLPRDSPAPRDFDRSSEHQEDYYASDHSSEHSRHRFAGNRHSSYDDHASYGEREGSRPSSRMSLNETSESGIYRDNDYNRKNYASDYERSPSRLSESEVYRSTSRRPYYDRPHDSAYYREDDYYRRMKQYGDYDRYGSSRNPYYGYYYPYGYNYNYGFYDELYRNDPRYKQQVEEHYREYYRRLGYETDPERLSVHSGCSSSANELAREQRYPDADGISNGSEYSSYVQQTDVYSEEHHSTPSTRLTPAKFSNPHPLGRFCSSGFLITVLPKAHSAEFSTFVGIHDVQVLMQDSEGYEELKSYDGPLIRGKTHKNDIIEFCLRKIKLYKQKSGVPDRDSYVLLWELLVLLLRQNGSVAGSDIAELLLKDHEILYPHASRTAIDTPQGVHSPTDGNEPSVSNQAGDTSSPDEGIVLARDKTILNAAHHIDPDKLARKYREFLLFGHKKEALEYAMKNGLWSHALFLSSKMDLRTYMIVLTRFTNSLAMNDPLQCLYQLMSGRQPTAITSIADKQWGDWRPHLAMILSNPSPNPENDSKCITTLGDTLASQGCLHAAHFCYLMAQVEFGYYARKSSKMVLLGSDHRLPFNTFASNEAIQCTEIYEYAQSLANPGFMLNHLQGYKFLYASRLMDHGFLPEALQYCEVLSSSFVSHPYSISADLITQVYQLANKLKYHDPCYLTCSDILTQEDPEWLKIFSTALQNLQNQVPSEGDENLSDEAGDDEEDDDKEKSKPEVESPHEYSKLDVQNNQNYYGNQSQAYFTPENQNFYSNNTWRTENNTFENTQVNSYENQPVQPSYNQYGGSSSQSPQHWSLPTPTVPNIPQEIQKTEPSSGIPTPSAAVSPHSSSQSFSGNKFDFHGSANHQVYNRERTSSTTSSLGYQKDRHDSAMSSGSDYGIGSAALKKKLSEDRKPDKKEDKSRQQVGRSWLGGIFSRLLPKAPNQMILPDDKNPTIIWDPVKKDWVNTDSNENDENSQPVAPPTDTELMRKTSFGEIPAPNVSMPSIPVTSVPTSTGVNKFQRPKIRGMRGNYVDVMNPSNSITNTNNVPPDALFPTTMPSQQSAPQLFVPSGPASDDTPVDFVSSGQAFLGTSPGDDDDTSDAAPIAPPMFDPAEFNSRRSSFNSAKHSVGPARRTYPT